MVAILVVFNANLLAVPLGSSTFGPIFSRTTTECATRLLLTKPSAWRVAQDRNRFHFIADIFDRAARDPRLREVVDDHVLDTTVEAIAPHGSEGYGANRLPGDEN